MSIASFRYQVRGRDGTISEGVIEAESESAARAQLRGGGLVVLDVRKNRSGSRLFAARVKMKDLAVFARQFAVMIDAGLTLLRALTILGDQVDNPTLRVALKTVKADVEQGLSLSAALAKHPKVFPPLMVNMTRAGETGGFLDAAMVQIADAYEAEVKLHGKIKAAMTYPAVVLVMAAIMCVAMLIFVVPTFQHMFTSLGGTLPLPTRILVAVSQILKVGLPGVVAVLGLAGWAWRKYRMHPAVRDVVDPLKLRLPVFGSLFQKLAIARFTRNFSTLLSAGVPILAGLDIVAETTGSVVVARAIRSVQESVKRGEPIARPLAAHPVFPPMVVQMVSVGEDTGALDQMLGKIAKFYDQEVESMAEALTSLIEPLLIAVLGTVVGSMIVALYLPMFKIYNLIHG